MTNPTCPHANMRRNMNNPTCPHAMPLVDECRACLRDARLKWELPLAVALGVIAFVAMIWKF